MGDIINARIPPRVEEKLAEYCAKRGALGLTPSCARSTTIWIRKPAGQAPTDLIPPWGVKGLQSGNVRKLARKAFRGSRAR